MWARFKSWSEIIAACRVHYCWLDCMALKQGKVFCFFSLYNECFIYTVYITMSLVQTPANNLPVYHISCVFTISEMVTLTLLLVREHWESMKDDMRNKVTEQYKNDSLTAHNHFKTRNRSTVTAEMYLPLFFSTCLLRPCLCLLPSFWWSVQGSRGEEESEWYTYYSLSLSILFCRWLTGPVWSNPGGKWL